MAGIALEALDKLREPSGGVFDLRFYQQECIDALARDWQKYKSLLAVLATGLGKTVIACEVALRWPAELGGVLFIAHRKELIDQAREKYEAHSAGDAVGVEMGAQRLDHESMLGSNKVTVTSIQTLNSGRKCRECFGEGCDQCMAGMRRRMQRFNPSDFGLLIYDEAHHATATTGLRAINYFRQNEHLRELYITATPERHDGVSMSTLVEHVAYQYDIKDAIRDGWLVPIRQRYVVVDGLDFSLCRTTAGDLNQKDLARAMGGAEEIDEADVELVKQQEEMLHAIVDPTIQEAKGRSTLVFTVTVAHAQRLCEIFCRHPGVTAEVVHGGTPVDEREAIIASFRNGETQILLNCGIATEGFDAPNCEVVVMARPTKSTGLYKQMIGRGTRPLPGEVDYDDSTATGRKAAIYFSPKPWMVVLDFVGNSGRHQLVSSADILAGEVLPQFVEAAKADATAEPIDVIELAEKYRAEAERKKQEAEEARRKQYEANQERLRREAEARKRIRARADYRTEEIDPFHGEAVAEQTAGEYRGGSTDAQINWLVSRGVFRRAEAMQLTKRQASEIIEKSKRKMVGGDYVLYCGKHRGSGKKLRDADPGYIEWVKTKMDDSWLRDELLYHIELMDEQESLQQEDVT